MLYVLAFVQPGGWEIVERFMETTNGNSVYESIVAPLTKKADRVYRVHPNHRCDVLKGEATCA